MSKDQKTIGEEVEAEVEAEVKSKKKLPSNYYFDNDVVEEILVEYHKTGCTNVSLRNEIMKHADELIINVIRTHNLHNIYVGKDDSSFSDLYQIAWCGIESALYKFNNDPGHSKIFNMWCMSPETMLLTSNGIQELADVSLGLKPQVYGIEGMNNVVAGLVKPETDVLKISTQYNYGVVCTPEHQLLTLDNKIIDFKETKNIKVGDLIGLQYNQQYFSEQDDISDIKLCGNGSWVPPQKLDEYLSYVCGLYIAEGSYSYNSTDFYNIDQDVLIKLQNNNIGLNYKHYVNNQVMRLNNKRFIEFLKKLGFGKEKAHNKFIPNRLLKMSKNNILSMLSGMFDGDGGSSRHNGTITYTTTSKKLMNQVRMLLLNLGIISKLSIDNRKISKFRKKGKEYTSHKQKCYQLILSTENSRKFYDEIGFGIKRKQIKKEFLPYSQMFMNCISDQFQKLHSKYGLCGCDHSKFRSLRQKRSKRELNNIIEGLKAYSEFHYDEDYKFIQDRIDEMTRSRNNIVWLRVEKIIDARSRVCEINVDSNTHSYIANGIISHNSQIARTAILAAIKKDNRDKKNSEGYRYYLDERCVKRSAKFDRFMTEAREICKYCDDFMEIIQNLEELYYTDSKPHEGLIGKLTKYSGMSRSKIIKFIKILRLMSFEFTDSPIGEIEHQERLIKPSEIAFTKEDD